MNRSFSFDDDWPRLLDRFGSTEDLDTSARETGALVRRREVRDAATLLRLGLGYGPGGMSLREAAAWAQLQGVAELSDVALLKRLRGAADWFGMLAGQVLAERAGDTGDMGARMLRLVDGTSIRAPGSTAADWRLHMGYDPEKRRFTAFELTDGLEAERLDRFDPLANEIRIADRDFGSRPDCIRALAQGVGDYVVRVNWRGLHWLDLQGNRFDTMGFLRDLGERESGEATVMIGRGWSRSPWTPFRARLIALRLPDDKARSARDRVLKETRRKGRAVKPETLEAAGHVLLLTSLDPLEYPAKRVGALYRLRWQVEIAFKRLKSLLHLDALRAKDPELARAWIFTNLIAAFMIDDMVQHTLDSPP
ncbi:IS4 family transposase [Labrenzia sp. R4_2]|uniref:IS4 family transposase n=1 Tax=Stappiaceae TaxID=2821832 RepID=UPI001ADC92AF|nr:MULTISPECIES: IS4 family transposase [Stappiaceae]MBO9422579.1 IS4 family transposase [Labrenzia sp. R4_2]